jgi:hypothetical protein
MDAAQVYGTDTPALPRARHALLIVAPAVLAGVYPWLLTGDLLLARASGGGAALAVGGVANAVGKAVDEHQKAARRVVAADRVLGRQTQRGAVVEKTGERGTVGGGERGQLR